MAVKLVTNVLLVTWGAVAVRSGRIYFAAGCFWGVEAFFQLVPGVVETQCGYANGHVENPGYELVCAGDTGFVECVRVDYDPNAISLDELLSQYLSIIDPTSAAPVQYQNGIYPADETDVPACKRALDALQLAVGAPVTVQLHAIQKYYPAEDYHQDYMSRHPEAHCHIDLSRFK